MKNNTPRKKRTKEQRTPSTPSVEQVTDAADTPEQDSRSHFPALTKELAEQCIEELEIYDDDAKAAALILLLGTVALEDDHVNRQDVVMPLLDQIFIRSFAFSRALDKFVTESQHEEGAFRKAIRERQARIATAAMKSS